ncbi:hypothetical protein C7974DRAFT_418237 [Boeremia exigua]|uniref:uncharacterized protein n=1 Tax=Boeremia exigua TaxID=749465 RepID=UPI001E8D4BA2|nr:uncharacterized protein C7974DRAFT_418237 [Boeremia exigua]KAH6613150.1 hypothetical protein C7974DRAFT_418237 [Boeremia exigua]
MSEWQPGSLNDESSTRTHAGTGASDILAHTSLNTLVWQDAQIDHDHYSGFEMCLDDRSWLASIDVSMDPVVPDLFSSPYDVYATESATVLSDRTMNDHHPNHMNPAPVPFQPGLVPMQTTPSSNIATAPATQDLFRPCYAEEIPHADSGPKKIRSPTSATPDPEDAVTKVGFLLNNGRLMCAIEGCEQRTFARPAELRRHHTTLHATHKPDFWCPVSTCRRSVAGSREAFHRKDKLAAHVLSMHAARGLELFWGKKSKVE